MFENYSTHGYEHTNAESMLNGATVRERNDYQQFTKEKALRDFS